MLINKMHYIFSKDDGELSPYERDFINSAIVNGVMPDLSGMWRLMDDAWHFHKCDQTVMDERVSKFYDHPVWLLNGLFIEQHAESLKHREEFTNYVSSKNPKRVADFGGGYGTLARMIGIRCPDTEVHIIEPHPHPIAVALAEKTPNVRYVRELSGEYDVLIATDVFEHVPDPLALVERTAAHLRVGGSYLIANCFWPVILCHLPSTFHFRWSWDKAMSVMNLEAGAVVAYGRSYKRVGPVLAAAARGIERKSRFWFEFIPRVPARFRPRLERWVRSRLT